MFTKQQYDIIAEVFNAGMPIVLSSMAVEVQHRTEDMLHHHNWLIGQMAQTLRADNPAFRDGKFFEACGWEEKLCVE